VRCAVVEDQTRFFFVAVEFAVPLELWEEDLDEPLSKIMMSHFVSIRREMGGKTVDHVDCPLKVIHRVFNPPLSISVSR
jgi:hypothetical protein